MSRPPSPAMTLGPWTLAAARAVRRMTPLRLWPAMMFLACGMRSRLLREFGYARSLKLKLPVNERDEPLPWMPYALSILLEERLSPQVTVLEFGAGFSTLFFMTRAASVVSVEHNAEWAARLRPRIARNVTVVDAPAQPPDAYLAPVSGGDRRYDLIVIDGVHRVECFRWAVDRLTPRGLIILDDSDRAAYRELFAWPRTAEFKALHVHGHKPCSVGLHRSTVFYRSLNWAGL